MTKMTYTEMVDSGIEWIGKIPKGWENKRISSLFTQRKEKVSDKDFQPLSVTKNWIVLQLDSAAKTDNWDDRKKVKSWDFVINSRSDRRGSSGLSKYDWSVSLINIVLKPIAKKNFWDYCHYLFKSKDFVSLIFFSLDWISVMFGVMSDV